MDKEEPPPTTSKDLLFCLGDEESKLLVVDGKDRINPKPPKISKPPPSAALAQARAFLPVLAAANAHLEQVLASDPSSLDIEDVEDDKPYVEMNLALIGEKDGSISGSDTDDSESEREDNEGGERETEEEEKGLPKRRKVLVQEIDNDKKDK